MGDITMVRGEEYRIQWVFKSDSVTPKDLTGYEVLIQIRPYEAATTLIEEFNETSPEVVFTPLSGSVLLTIPQYKTADYTFTKAVMDCWVYVPNQVDGDRSSLEYITFRKGSSIE